MAVRNDVSINWAVSPRIAMVAAPSTEITIQDIVDTFRTLESEMGALDDASLLDATGKDYLGLFDSTEVRVGITLRLLNTRIAFEERPGPHCIQCVVSGGNLTAVDAVGDTMNPIEPTDHTQIIIEKSTSPSLLIPEGQTADIEFIKEKVTIIETEVTKSNVL